MTEDRVVGVSKGKILALNNWELAQYFAVFASAPHNTQNHQLGPLMNHTLMLQKH